MPGGRPPIFTDPKEMDRLVDEYVALCREKDEPILWLGMVLHLGFSCRQSMDSYAEKPEFLGSVKRAKAIIEHEYEKRLVAQGNAGSIFALKNFGWKDKHETELTGADGGAIKTDNTFTITVVGE